MKLGLIGYGNIATKLVQVLAAEGQAPDQLDVLARPAAGERAAASLPGAVIHHDVEALIAAGPDLVVEAATHQAVRDAVPACLRAGIPCIVVSIGALADPQTEAALTKAATAGGTQMRLVAGAVGGIDMLAAARLSGLTEVTYTSRKPPRRLAGNARREDPAPVHPRVGIDLLRGQRTAGRAGLSQECQCRRNRGAGRVGL